MFGKRLIKKNSDSFPSRSAWKIPLFDQKEVVRNILFEYLTLEEAKGLATQSVQFHEHVKNKILVIQLLQFVVYGDELQAASLIEKDSSVLLERGSVTDYSGRTFFNHTPLELAKWAYDSKMCATILKYLTLLPNGKKIAADQLNKLIEYRVQSSQLVQKEFHYNIHDYIILFQKYADLTVDDETRDACWVNEVGMAQRNVPAWIAKKLSSDSLILWDGSPYFPLDQNPSFRLGIHFAIYSRLCLASGPRDGLWEKNPAGGPKNEIKWLMTLFKKNVEDLTKMSKGCELKHVSIKKL